MKKIDNQTIISQAGVIFILMPILILIFSLATGAYLPVFGWFSIFTVLGGSCLYAFANTGFAYIMKHGKPWQNTGSAEKVPDPYFFDLTRFRLGIQSPGNTHIIVNLKELPFTIHFFGRWVCYLIEDHKLELWHDHIIFGGQWFYIQY